jgi:hypothetical protein
VRSGIQQTSHTQLQRMHLKRSFASHTGNRLSELSKTISTKADSIACPAPSCRSHNLQPVTGARSQAVFQKTCTQKRSRDPSKLPHMQQPLALLRPEGGEDVVEHEANGCDTGTQPLRFHRGRMLKGDLGRK